MILGKACDLIDQHRAQRKPSGDSNHGGADHPDPPEVTSSKVVSFKKTMAETSNDLKASAKTLDAKIQNMFGSKVQNLNFPPTTATSAGATAVTSAVASAASTAAKRDQQLQQQEDKLMPISENYYKDFSNKLNSKPNLQIVSKFGEKADDFELKSALHKIGEPSLTTHACSNN